MEGRHNMKIIVIIQSKLQFLLIYISGNNIIFFFCPLSMKYLYTYYTGLSYSKILSYHLKSKQ